MSDTLSNLTASTGSLTNPFRYTARESDAETGLYYHRTRYYDPIYRQISEAHGPDAMTWKAPCATYVGGVNTALAGPGTRSGRGGLLPFPQISTLLLRFLHPGCLYRDDPPLSQPLWIAPLDPLCVPPATIIRITN